MGRWDLQFSRQAEPAKQVQAPSGPLVSPFEHTVGLADPDELVLMEDLAPRRVARRLVPEYPGTTGVDEQATGGKGARAAIAGYTG
jgi:hypothetical protein